MDIKDARIVLRLAAGWHLIVLLAEDVLGRLNEYVRLAGKVCNGPAGGAALKGFSRQPCFSWFSSSLAYAFLFFFHTGLLVCTANINHDCLQSTSLTETCMFCFNGCSGIRHTAVANMHHST